MPLLPTWRDWWHDLWQRRTRRTGGFRPRATHIESLEVRVVPAATAVGNVFDVPSTTSGTQNYDALATATDGSFNVVFADNGLDGNGWGIFSRHFGADGQPAGNQIQLNSTTVGDQFYPMVATNSSGVSLAVWLNERNDGGGSFPVRLDMQFLDANGALQGDNLNLIPEGNGSADGSNLDVAAWGSSPQPLVFADNSGNFWVAVPVQVDDVDFSGKQIDFWKVQTDGTATKMFDVSLANESNGANSTNLPVNIELGSNGTFYVTFSQSQIQSVSGGGQRYDAQLIVRRFSSTTGQAIGQPIIVDAVTYFNTWTYNDFRFPTVVPQSNGAFSVVYYTGAGDIVGKPYDSQGLLSGSQFVLVNHTQLDPSLGLDPVAAEPTSEGHILLVWNDPLSASLNRYYAREFLADGTTVGSAATVAETSNPGAIHVAAQPDDGFIVSWTDQGTGDVEARLLALQIPPAGVTVTQTSAVTTEAGGTATFDVVLDSAPSGNVTIPLNVSDSTEGSLSSGFLTFTPQNWDTPQTVTVTGVNDDVVDGNTAYDVLLGPATSSDQLYNGLTISPVAFVNQDDDVPGIIVIPTTAPATTEAGGTASFQIQMLTQPLADVTVTLVSDTPTEGTVSTSTLLFTPQNWSTTRLITVTGQDDARDDGDQVYHIVFQSIVSTDEAYANLSLSPVTLQNIDNDTAGFNVSPTSGLETTEQGGTAEFTVALTSQPTADVTIAVSSSDTDEGTVDKTELVFTSENWNVSQTVTVTGVDDGAADGNAAYQVVLAPATSEDATYANLDPSDVSLINIAPNTPPTLALAGATPRFGKKSPPVALIETATVTDDQPNFDGGQLRITIASGYNSRDMLQLSTSVGGVSIGSFTGSGNQFFINFNANATPEAIEQLLQNLKFSTSKKGLKTSQRTIEFQLTDGDGAVSQVIQRSIQVSKKKLK